MLATVNKLATKLLREHGPINWPNSQTTRVQMHWHISQVPTWPAPARTVPVPGHVIQRCDSCQMVMVIRIRIRILLRLALPEIRLVETQIRVCTMWQQSPLQADWWLCLRPVAMAWGETGLAGWQATRRTIQFNSRPNSNSISIASCQLTTCNVQLVADWFYFWVYQRINCNIFGHFLCLSLPRLPCVVFRPRQWHVAVSSWDSAN